MGNGGHSRIKLMELPLVRQMGGLYFILDEDRFSRLHGKISIFFSASRVYWYVHP